MMYSKAVRMIKQPFWALFPIRRLSRPAVKAVRDDDLFTKLPPSSMALKRLVPLRGYMYLPGNQDEGMPPYLQGPKENFPFAVQCSKRDLYTQEDWGRALQEYVDEYLPKYRAILFRGLPLRDGESFNNLIEHTGYEPISYRFGTERRNIIAGSVYASSTASPPYIIEMHNEASYTPSNILRKLFFYCKTPAPIGGETPLCRTDSFMTDIDSHFIQKLRDKKVRYMRILADRTKDPISNWQHIMMAETKKEIEEDFRKLNISWRWNANGALISWYTKEAFLTHPETGEELWFNQATAHHRSFYDCFTPLDPSDNFEDYPCGFHCQYGDGEEIEDHYLQQIRNLSWRQTVGIQLEAGDVIVIDNLHCQHGRLNYHGKREMFLAFAMN